jgi:hypothetical protein
VGLFVVRQGSAARVWPRLRQGGWCWTGPACSATANTCEAGLCKCLAQSERRREEEKENDGSFNGECSAAGVLAGSPEK